MKIVARKSILIWREKQIHRNFLILKNPIHHHLVLLSAFLCTNDIFSMKAPNPASDDSKQADEPAETSRTEEDVETKDNCTTTTATSALDYYYKVRSAFIKLY